MAIALKNFLKLLDKEKNKKGVDKDIAHRKSYSGQWSMQICLLNTPRTSNTVIQEANVSVSNRSGSLFLIYLVDILLRRKGAGWENGASCGYAPDRRISAPREGQCRFGVLSHSRHMLGIQSRPRRWRTISRIGASC